MSDSVLCARAVRAKLACRLVVVSDRTNTVSSWLCVLADQPDWIPLFIPASTSWFIYTVINYIRRISLLIAIMASPCYGQTASAAAAYEPQVREYWIAAEKVEWDYAPAGNQLRPDRGLGVWGKRSQYSKYRYIAYTDATYKTRIAQPVWMGLLGPQLRAVVGDTLLVHFQNNADKPLSMHPHGMQYDMDNDGADLRGKGGVIAPGKSYTYSWIAAESSGPVDESSTVWLYHSHVDPNTEVNDGLVGTIVVTKAGMQRSLADPAPVDVDREFTTFFMVFDEEEGAESGLMHAHQWLCIWQFKRAGGSSWRARPLAPGRVGQ